MIKVGVSGALGRMGQRIIALAAKDPALKVCLAFDRLELVKTASELIPQIKFSADLNDLTALDVLIDFTLPQATLNVVAAAVKAKKALVVGTTGLVDEQIQQIKTAAKTIPIVYAPNMSVGVNVLFSLLPQLAAKLGPDYNIEIIEAHHDQKKDAPSGTAKKMADILKLASKKEITTHSIRLGDIVGDHTVIFCGNSERIEIKHQAHSRDLFVVGALRAAKWLINQPAGLYSMQDVLA